MSPQNNPYADFWNKEATASQPKDKNQYADFWAKETTATAPTKKPGLLKGIGEFIMNAPKKLMGGAADFENTPTGQKVTSALEATSPLKVIPGVGEAALGAGTGILGFGTTVVGAPIGMAAQAIKGEPLDLNKAVRGASEFASKGVIEPKGWIGNGLVQGFPPMAVFNEGKRIGLDLLANQGVSPEALEGAGFAADVGFGAFAPYSKYLKGRVVDFIKDSYAKRVPFESAPVKAAIKASGAPVEVKLEAAKLPDVIEPSVTTPKREPLKLDKNGRIIDTRRPELTPAVRNTQTGEIKTGKNHGFALNELGIDTPGELIESGFIDRDGAFLSSRDRGMGAPRAKDVVTYEAMKKPPVQVLPTDVPMMEKLVSRYAANEKLTAGETKAVREYMKATNKLQEVPPGVSGLPQEPKPPIIKRVAEELAPEDQAALDAFANDPVNKALEAQGAALDMERLGIKPKGAISQLSGKELKRGGEAGFLTIKDAAERPVSAPVESEIQATFSLKKHQKLWADLVDRYKVVDTMVNDFVKKKDIPIDVANDPSMLVRLYAGTPGKAEAKLFKGRFRTSPEGSITWAGEPLAAIFKYLPEADKSSFSEYLVKRHVPEVAAKGKETGFDVAEAQRFVAANAPRFEARAKRFTDYHNALMEELVDAGLMKTEVRDQLRADYPNYAAMNRVIEDLQQFGHVPSSRNTFLKIPNPIKRQKGSELPVIDPAESAVRLTYEITNAVERQKVKSAIINLRKLSPELAEIIKPVRPDVEHIGDPGRLPHPKAMQREGIVDILENGERHYYQVPPDLYKMMGNLDSVSSGWLIRALSVPSRVLRAGATMGPSFAFARNPMRDQLSAFVNAKHGFVPGVDFARGLFEMVGKGEDYWKWKASGGEWSMLVSLDRAANQAKLSEVMGKRKSAGDYIRHPIQSLEAVSMFGERPTRIGTFKRAKRAGETDLVAARESREASVDFATRGGAQGTKDVASLYAFLNARTQGTTRIARSFKERPVATTVKAFTAATIPSVVLYLNNRNDPEYWKQPEWKRRMFWMIKIPGTKRFIPIPKGEIGMIFGNTAEHILGYIDKKDPKVIAKIAGDFLQAASPISSAEELLPNAFRPGVGIATNYNVFYGRPIDPRGKEALEPGLRYGRNTSETAKAIGKKLNISPSKIDYLVSSQLAEVGRLGVKGLDLGLGEMGIIPKKAERPSDIADIPLVGALVTREAGGFGSETVNQFYEAYNDLTKFSRSADFMKKGNEASDLAKYVSRHKEFAAMHDSGLMTEMNSAVRRLSELRRAEDSVLAATGVSKENKQIALDKLDEEVMKVVVPIMDRYRTFVETYK
jgi:hypothetical protein